MLEKLVELVELQQSQTRSTFVAKREEMITGRTTAELREKKNNTRVVIKT